MKMLALIGVTGVMVLFGVAPQAWAIQGGHKPSSNDPIARATVAVNVHFAAEPGAPADHSLNPCTGVLVDDDLVLTAAHCIRASSTFQIIFSADAGDAHATVREVSAFDVPLDFHYGNPSPSKRSDIALLYFQGGLPSGFVKAPVLLDLSAIKAGTTVSALGYGPCRDAAHCTLTETETRVANDDYWPTELQLQVSSAAYLTFGDSGGPAFAKVDGEWKVFGIDNGSWANLVETYAGIGAHSDWLNRASTRLRTTNVSQGPGWSP